MMDWKLAWHKTFSSSSPDSSLAGSKTIIRGSVQRQIMDTEHRGDSLVRNELCENMLLLLRFYPEGRLTQPKQSIEHSTQLLYCLHGGLRDERIPTLPDIGAAEQQITLSTNIYEVENILYAGVKRKEYLGLYEVTNLCYGVAGSILRRIAVVIHFFARDTRQHCFWRQNYLLNVPGMDLRYLFHAGVLVFLFHRLMSK